MSEGIGRRGFFRIVGAGSAAAATAAGCGRATEAILPYVVPPEHGVPGVAVWYATVCRECPAGCGVLARSREGRVVKLEGNPDHPVNRGALCARGQAALLGTYDPDRLTALLERRDGRLLPVALPGGERDIDPLADPAARRAQAERRLVEAERRLVERLQAARQRPGRIAMITGLETGSLGRLMDEWLRALGGRPRIAYEPFAYEALRAANRTTFGVDAIPYYAFEDARVVLSLGADFLETWLSPVGFAAGFRLMRTLREGTRGTVVHVEPRYSLTAANADEWIPNAPGTEGAIALALLRIVLERKLAAGLSPREAEALAALVSTVEPAAVARQSGVGLDRLQRLAERLARQAPSLVVGGGVAVTGLGATDAAVAVNLLNYALGNVGRTVRFGPNAALGRASTYAEVLALIRAMAAGEIEVLIVKDANPVFTLPPRAGFVEALERVPFVVSLSSHLDETTARAHLVIPDLTPLESWGDYVAREGVHGLLQPAMAPVPAVGPRRQDALEQLLRRPDPVFPGVETRAAGDLLLATGRALVPGSDQAAFRAKTFADYVRENWQALARTVAPGEPFESFWEAALRRGGVFTDVPTQRVALQPGLRLGPAPPAFEGPAEGPVLLPVPSSRYYDGRSANKVWLHEAPDPMTQLVYDGWVEVPAATARRLGLRPGDLVRVRSPHGQVELPAWVSETLHPEAVAIPLGLGHTAYGRFARDLGANPVTLLPAAPDPVSGGLPWLAVRVTLEATGQRREVGTPAGVAEVDPSREIIEVLGLAEAVALEQAGRPPAPASLPTMYPDLRYPEHRWGMVVDLDACTGCQACVVACQAENNVPVAGLAEISLLGEPGNQVAAVGRRQVSYGRSLHWLRVERWWDRGHGAETGAGHAGSPGPGLAYAAEPTTPAAPAARFIPMLCQHCGVAPCEPVCPVFAAYHTQEGLNGQVYNRCVGTRYCGNNCPYMVRRFNWYRYAWPAPMPLVLNPDVTVRDRGVMEKCTMCVQRIIEGKAHARDEGRRPRDGEIVPACQQTCPTQAIVFGDLKDGGSRVARLAASPRGYHVLAELGTRPAVTYLRKIVGEGGA